MHIMSSQFLWIDLETTGLHPGIDNILEWAVLAVDDTAQDMPILDAASGVLGVPRGIREGCSAVVRNMHDANGLWDACAAATDTVADAERKILLAVGAWFGRDASKVVLAGASVHFDLAFVREHMPRLAKLLSHRVFDVSTLKAFARLYPGGFADLKADAHRAMADVTASLAETRAFRSWACPQGQTLHLPAVAP